MTTTPSIEQVYRTEAGRVLATLIRLIGDFELAEEARQEAFTAAIEQWPASGLPDNPRAWLISVGRRKAIDQIRRRVLLRNALAELANAAEIEAQVAPYGESDDATFGDDRLRLIFTCCHPALTMEARVALTLHTICDLSTEAVARAFLVSADTMGQRLLRAKRKIREARIPYDTPTPALLDERIQGVLAVIYLVFSEGYAATEGAKLIREELCRDALRLGRLLDALLPGRADVKGLLALMLLHDARREARLTPEGDVILLEDQDRALWDHSEIADGLALVDESLRTPERISVYSVQAAIAALHVSAPAREETDWPQIVGLYEVLLRLQPNPVVELNHAVAVAMVDGPARALDLMDSLCARGQCGDYHLLHAARGHMLQRLNRPEEAGEAYGLALKSARTEPERRLLERRVRDLKPES